MQYKEPEQVPAGTSVVTTVDRADESGYLWKRGTAASVARSEWPAPGEYLLETLTGALVPYQRREFVLQRLHLPLSLQVEKEGFDPTPYLVMLAGVGSNAHGLATEESDLDLKGVYVLPFHLRDGIFRYPQEKDDHRARVGERKRYDPARPLSYYLGDGADNSFYEVEKFVLLGLQADPTVLEMLWTPIWEALTPSGAWLREARSLFVTRHLERSFSNYARNQFRRFRNRKERGEGSEGRPAMNLVRLLYSANHFLATGEPLLDVSPYRDFLLGIKRGEVSLEETEAEADRLVQEFNERIRASDLPENPDLDAANRLVLGIRFAESGLPVPER